MAGRCGVAPAADGIAGTRGAVLAIYGVRDPLQCRSDVDDLVRGRVGMKEAP